MIYEANPLIEVECELRFAPILMIDTEPPALFQDRIRDAYPDYRRSYVDSDLGAEGMPEEVGKFVEQTLSPFFNHERRLQHDFVSEDGVWRVGLTRESIALTCNDYRRWEGFRARLEEVLAVLEEVYRPHSFTRVGLQYVDLILREELGLGATPWSEVLQPHIAAELGAPPFASSEEVGVRRVLQADLWPGMSLTLQHGLARARRASSTPDAGYEVAYIIDMEFSWEERTDVNGAFDALDRAHLEAGRLFRWCISQRLHEALRPQPTDS